MGRKTRRFYMALLCLGAVSLVHGQSPGRSPQDLDDLVFKVAVFGPADEIFIWWGHAALIVENTRWNYSRVFDWGIFSYPGDNFLLDFLHNRVQYQCTAGYSDIQTYINEDRDIALYTLDLEREAKNRMLDYAENKTLPENCYYDYHEFRDNCSTGVRDILDLGLGGQLRDAFAAAPGRMSLRRHVRRYTWSRPVVDWFFDFLMGQDLDEPVSVWDEMFLPVEIGRNISAFRYTGEGGRERALVSAVELVNAAKNRPPILHRPLDLRLRSFLLGLAAAAVLSGCGALRKKYPRGGRILWGAVNGFAGLALGLAGSVLFFGLCFMPNDYIQQNANILFVNPLLLAAVPLGVFTALGKDRKLRGRDALPLFWALVFAMGCLSVLMKGLPPFFQQNGSVQALILPPVFVLAFQGGRGSRAAGNPAGVCGPAAAGGISAGIGLGATGLVPDPLPPPASWSSGIPSCLFAANFHSRRRTRTELEFFTPPRSYYIRSLDSHHGCSANSAIGSYATLLLNIF